MEPVAEPVGATEEKRVVRPSGEEAVKSPHTIPEARAAAAQLPAVSGWGRDSVDVGGGVATEEEFS